jgi:hypothetical protein
VPADEVVGRDRGDLPVAEHGQDVALELVAVPGERAAREIAGGKARLLIAQPLVGDLGVDRAPAARRRRRAGGLGGELVAQPARLHQPDRAELPPADRARAQRRRAREVNVARSVQPALDADATVLRGIRSSWVGPAS